MQKRIFITGPTGAVGIALIDVFIRKKFEIVAICRKNSKRINHIPKHNSVKVIECDMAEINGLSEEKLGNGEYFFHLAWAGTSGEERNNLELQLSNVQYTIDCIRLAHRLKCKKFIGTGSQAEYGKKNEKLTTDLVMNPFTGYGAGKLCASYMGSIEAHKLGIAFNWVRVLSVYGPYDGMHTLVMSLIKKLSNDEDVELTEGIQTWDYLYSDDAAKALCMIAEKGLEGRTYVLGSGIGRPLREYIETIARIVPNHSKLLWGKIPYTEQTIMYLCASREEIYRDIGFCPETDFEVGILKTYQWYRGVNTYEKN